MDPKKGTPSAPFTMRKHNTENPANAFQYHTPRGTIVHQVAQATVNAAPNPTDPRNCRKFPKVYRNEEKVGDKMISRYDKRWETGAAGTLYEFPVAHPVVQPGAQAFDYSKNPAPLSKVDRYNAQPLKTQLGRDLKKPAHPAPNDPGAFRVVTDHSKNIKGVNYHPKGDPKGFNRAKMQPLDQGGLQQVKEQKKKSLFGRRTWD